MPFSKVIIDKEVLDLNSPASVGLVSGLKKLSDKQAILCVNNYDDVDEALRRIIDLENIKVNQNSAETPASNYIIRRNIKQNTLVILDDKKEFTAFSEAADHIIRKQRSAVRQRTTKETDITVSVELDGEGSSNIITGIGFFDHMLEQIAKHANINLDVKCKGDLHVDEHHTIEDTGITLGEALREALGDKKGIQRYGYFLPMDEAITRCAIDLSGRGYLLVKAKFKRTYVGDFPTEMAEEFFRGVASGMKTSIYLKVKGKNDHHKIEGMFKAFAKSLNEACRMDERVGNRLPTTKGTL
jgi:imidazoleglycerol-phosphate dehydratase/histidinol-phosphatase